MTELQLAITAALESGKKILKIYNSKDFDVKLKSDKSPLTKADIESHNIIVSYLESSKIPILSEEGKNISFNIRKKWKKLWIVDPIDGTKEFIKRNGEFTVNIALVENQKVKLGVIYAPALNQLYFSSDKIGSFRIVLNTNSYNFNSILNKAEKLPLERKDNIFTIVASRSHMSKETEDFIKEMKNKYGDVKLISKGSSLKLCMVAEGTADCYPRFAPTMEWDTAAGQAICENAGFSVFDQSTKKIMIYNRTNLLNNWFLVKKNK